MSYSTKKNQIRNKTCREIKSGNEIVHWLSPKIMKHKKKQMKKKPEFVVLNEKN